MAMLSTAQALAERRISSFSSGPSRRDTRPFSCRHFIQKRVTPSHERAHSVRLHASEPIADRVTSNGHPSKNGHSPKPPLPTVYSPPALPPVKQVSQKSQRDRYGWPDRSDMYIMRTDGNVCARTLVKGTGRLQLAYPSSHQYMMVWKQKPKTVMIVKKLGDELLPQLTDLAMFLVKEERVNVVVEPHVHQRLAEEGGCPEVYTYTPDQGKRLGEFIDFVVCLGGDGVLLHTAQVFGQNVPPIIAFHLGSLGFMSQHGYEAFQHDLSGIINGQAPLDSCKVNESSENQLGVYVSLRMRLKCEIKRSGKLGIEQCHEVLNEMVIDRGSSSFLTNINVYESGNFMTCVQADGLMIATPTGSTAYSAAAGGSMVHPNVPAILFTPICPHSLNFRPIILPDYSVLELRIADDARASAWVSFDGKHRQELHQGDVMSVRMSPNPVATINRVDQTQDWMRSLNRCFGWSERITQRGLEDQD